MYPHRIRLLGPWECEPLSRLSACATDTKPVPPPLRMKMPCHWDEGGLPGFVGRVRFRRRFGYPGRIDAHERVWLTFAAVAGSSEVRLNGTFLGEGAADHCPFEFEVTALLRERNELVVEVESATEPGGLCGAVALEVRCSAYLRGVRVWAEGGDLHAAGEVVGAAEGLLELYVVRNRSTAAYQPTSASPGGHAFHLVAAGALPGTVGEDAAAGRVEIVKVDLVNGASVWYTFEQELPPSPGRKPAG
jgi:hypothetical protein